MTYTRTFTYEERAWELAIEASDPEASSQQRAQSLLELKAWIKEMPADAERRVDEAARQIGVAIAMKNSEERSASGT